MNPYKLKARVLFVRNGCPHCRLYKKFIHFMNSKIKLSKRIEVVDCTNYDLYGIEDNPLISLYKEELEAYPTLFFGTSKIEGANSIIELKTWLKVRFMLNDDFIFPEENEYLPNIQKPLIEDFHCQYSGGRLICH